MREQNPALRRRLRDGSSIRPSGRLRIQKEPGFLRGDELENRFRDLSSCVQPLSNCEKHFQFFAFRPSSVCAQTLVVGLAKHWRATFASSLQPSRYVQSVQHRAADVFIQGCLVGFVRMVLKHEPLELALPIVQSRTHREPDPTVTLCAVLCVYTDAYVMKPQMSNSSYALPAAFCD